MLDQFFVSCSSEDMTTVICHKDRDGPLPRVLIPIEPMLGYV